MIAAGVKSRIAMKHTCGKVPVNFTRIKSRSAGRTQEMVHSIIPLLQGGEEVKLLGCKDPHVVSRYLKAEGITVGVEPIYSTGPQKAIYTDDGWCIGFKDGKTTLIGYSFKIKPPEQAPAHRSM